MNRFTNIIALSLSLCCSHNLPLMAQRIGGGFDMYNFIDNSEGDDTYRKPVTYAGTRFTPTLSFATNDSLHRVVGGYNFLFEYGKKTLSKGDIEIYYQFKNENLRILFGSFPRRLMHEQMPDYLICDSIKYFRPEMTGVDFLYTTRNGHVEVFLDWTKKRSATDREQFMLGASSRFRFNKFQMGIDGHMYHYALEEGENCKGHAIHDIITTHPYVGMLLGNATETVIADLRGGILLHYWGDSFTRSQFYSRTDVGYNILQHKNVNLDTKLTFNFTDKGMQWHQMLTLRFNLNEEYHVPSKKFYCTD